MKSEKKVSDTLCVSLRSISCPVFCSCYYVVLATIAPAVIVLRHDAGQDVPAMHRMAAVLYVTGIGFGGRGCLIG